MTTLQWGARTDTGRVRRANQDTALVGERLFAVADGMGGHAAGEVASQVAVETLKTIGEPTADGLVDGVRLANRAVYDRSVENPEYRGMGTTLTALALVEEDGEDRIDVVNVGDSRAYLYRDGELTQLTQDHSLVEDMVRGGQISPEEAREHPQRNILTRVLGIEPDVEVDTVPVVPYTGDRFLLCSDGLVNEVEDNRIASVLRRLSDPDEAATELVRMANEGGGRDNITCVVVDVLDDNGRAAAASQALAGDRVVGDKEPPPEVLTPKPGTHVTGQVPAVTTVGAADGDTLGADAGRRPRRLTWRVGVFVLALLAVAVAAAGAVWWFARNTYYVAFDGEEVAIFRGRPGGLLWFDPTLEQDTGIPRDQVPAATVDDLEDGREYSTKSDAVRYVDNLEDRIAEGGAGTTSTTLPPVGSTSTSSTSP
jgi:PPM family protein phosphatase